MTQYNAEIWVKEQWLNEGERFVPQRVKYLPYPVDTIDALKEILKLMKIPHYRIYEHSPNQWKDTGMIIETTPELQQFIDQMEIEENEHIESMKAKVQAINELPKETIIGEYKGDDRIRQLIIIRNGASYKGHGIIGAEVYVHIRIKGNTDPDDDDSLNINDFRSTNGRILWKRLQRHYGARDWGREIINDFDNIRKKYDEFREQIQRIVRG